VDLQYRIENDAIYFGTDDPESVLKILSSPHTIKDIAEDYFKKFHPDATCQLNMVDFRYGNTTDIMQNKMIKAGCPHGNIVLDPFMGSGTTAVAAKRLERHWVGIELNKEYIAFAEKRIANTVSQLQLEAST